jgi:hypothetical protein
MFNTFGTAKIRLVALCAATVLPASLPTSAVAAYFDISGTTCAAYNNAQADWLERSHVRIYNPPTSPVSIWVVCPLPRDHLTANLATWAVAAFFQAPAPVTCVFREFNYDTVHVPGSGTQPGLLNATSVNIPAPGVLPGVAVGAAASVTDTATANSSYTVTCLLQPGTGINLIAVTD